MQVILKEDVPKLGSKGSVVKVSPGFARNYLLPKGLAAPASDANIRDLESKQKEHQKREDRTQHKAEEISKILSQKTFVIKAKAGIDSKLFGTITSSQIASIVEKQTKINIDKKHINLSEPIKYLGVHKVDVKLHPEVNAQLTIEVIGEE